jgi:hypothetical protein
MDLIQKFVEEQQNGIVAGLKRVASARTGRA